MNGRPWTKVEKELMHGLYGHDPAADLALLLSRSVGQIYQAAERFGLTEPRRKFTPAMEATLRRRHAEGWTDVAIAAELGIDRKWLQSRRARLGLPANMEAVLEARRRSVRTQYERLGIATGGDLRRLAFRRFARANGWPEDLRPREVQILNVLAARGVPMSRLELAAAIGMRTDRMGSNGTLALLGSCNGPGGTYTASLMRRGLVVSLGRLATVMGQGKGRSRHLYALGPLALSILQSRAEACTTTATVEER